MSRFYAHFLAGRIIRPEVSMLSLHSRSPTSSVEQTQPMLRSVGLPVVGKVTAPIYERLRGFANSKACILLRGPTGVGKSRLAMWIHDQSPRRDRSFVEPDLHGVPPELAASALFGHRRGAYTGAHENRRGRLAEADGGTLFLDEIDKLGLGEQALLLRILEQNTWREVGGDIQHADVRFLAGTNVNLEREVKARRFREDLFYRVNVVPVHLPPLDERRDEILPWAEHMLSELQGTEEGLAKGASLSAAAAALLEVQRWPGNLRQLRHVIERGWLLARMETPEGPVELTDQHVQTALLLDHPEELRQYSELQRNLVDSLERAARLGAQIVLRRAERGEPPLALGVWEGFAGLVLDAVGRYQPLDRRSTAHFGLESQVAGSNYKKTYQRLSARGAELMRALLEP